MPNLIELIGFLAVLLHVVAFVTTDRKTMLTFGMMSTGFFGVGLINYEGINGMLVTFASLFAKSLNLLGYEEGSRILVRFSPIIAIGFFLISDTERWYGLLPAASLFFIIIADSQDNVVRMKQWYLGSAICWLIYGVVLASPPAIMYDLVGLGALAYGIRQAKIIQDPSRIDCLVSHKPFFSFIRGQ